MDPAQLARWNQRFSDPGYIFGTAPNAFLARQASRLRPGLRALCVADGEGRNSTWLASQGLRVTAFDFSPVGLAKARALAARTRVDVDYRESDIFAWQWEPAAYDVVAVIFTQFMGAEARREVFAGIESTLAPGGLLLMEGYRPEQLAYATGGPKEVENFYTEPALRESFARLEILELAAYDAEVDEGPGHQGMSALIDLVARKPA